MINVANRWQSEIRVPSDGTQPNAGTWGTPITADSTPHTKGAWTDVIAAADWSGFTGDAMEIEVRFNSMSGSATDHRGLADIGVDSGGGYASIIDNLACGYASGYGTNGEGVAYRFPLHIANGVKIGCRLQALIASDTVNVSIIVRGNPTNPGIVRVGTSVTTINADTANSDGSTKITGGAASDGAWTELAASTADDYWAWEFGWTCQDTAWTGGAMNIDVATGAAAAEVAVITNFYLYKQTTEVWAKPPQVAIAPVPSGSRVSCRIQAQGNESNQSIILYAVSGNYELPGLYTIAGTVTIDGVAASDGGSYVILAIDSDGVAERLTADVLSNGDGTFTFESYDDSRIIYFVVYEDGTNRGVSEIGTPDVDTFDITINTGSGGGLTPPRVGSPFIR